MAKEIEPKDVSAQLEFEIGDAIDFCSDVLEDVNAHNVAYVLAAINAGAYEIAKEFVELEKDQEEAGELTDDLRERREVLLERLDKFEPGEEEEHHCDDDCRSYGCRRK